MMSFGPTIYVVVADDADTPDAAALRASVADAVHAGLVSLRRERFGSCGSPDPAAWHPSDARVILARPSAPDGESLLSPLDDPALAWETTTSSVEEIDAVTAAVSNDLGARLAKAGEIYRPLHAAKRALDLLYGTRLPESDAEKTLLASVREDTAVQVLIATSRDDEDGTPVTGLVPAVPADVLANTPRLSLMGPAAAPPASYPACYAPALSASRLEAWRKSVSLDTTLYAWPCSDSTAWDRILDGGFADCSGPCDSAPIAVADGVAQCQVFLDQADLDACDPAHGWRDPDGQPTFVERDGVKLRRCEIVQLSGAALESCRTTLDCSGCGSGYCVTEVPQLSDWSCGAGQYPWPLRFPGGALAGDEAWIQMTCQVAQ
jgi:hypothetical protein